MQDRERVLLIYTGGTIGMIPKDEDNPLSPLAPASLRDLIAHFPALRRLNLETEHHNFDPLLDSSNMKPADWIEIARTIKDNYSSFDGFVVLHGTDTMAYTTSALSFLLENLQKPVVVTGSQLPIGNVFNDGMENLAAALMLASPRTHRIQPIPEVILYFRNKILRGSRAHKLASSELSGFDSPNAPALGVIEEHIILDPLRIRDVSSENFFIHESLDLDVWSIDLFPGIQPSGLRSFFALPGLRGVILNTFGAGNAPSDDDFIDVLKEATEKGIVIVDVTQCTKGLVELGLYDVSDQLLDAGVVSGLDLTKEAALTKLMFLLGQGYDPQTVRTLMEVDQRGEQTYSIYKYEFGSGKAEPVFNAPPTSALGNWKKNEVQSALLRFRGLRRTNGQTGQAVLRAYISLPTADESTPTDAPQHLPIGTIDLSADTPRSIQVDATDVARRIMMEGMPTSINIVAGAGDAEWDALTLSLISRKQ